MPSKKELLARALSLTGTGALLRRISPWRGLLILNYHRIGDASRTGYDPGVFSATSEEFDSQLAWLRQNADVIGLGELDRALGSRRGRHVLLTFDDGYRDNFELAFPLLQRHRIPAAFFITTGFIDDRPVAWWDEISWMVKRARHRRLPETAEFAAGETEWEAGKEPDIIRRILKVYKALPTDRARTLLNLLGESTGVGRCPPDADSAPWMDWEMVRSLHAAGHAIAAHTVTHPLLANCSPEQQERELVDSKARLESILGNRIEAFSYPVGIPGSYSDETARLVRQAGYRWAFSFQGGYADASRGRDLDVYRLPRVAMETGLSGPRFQAIQTLPALFA